VPTAIFLKSAASPADFPEDVGREVAFVGRSNSGKSTAINLVAGARKLARVSKTPGRTQLINFFVMDEDRRLVDLPGYGFARVAPGVREQWRRLIDAYVAQRQSLAGVVVTVDIRRGITDLDDALLRWLAPRDLRVGVLLTKSDKLSRSAALARERDVARSLDAAVPLTRFSSLTREGVDTARSWLTAWLSPDAPPSLDGTHKEDEY
jgi:GTP-binding protein